MRTIGRVAALNNGSLEVILAITCFLFLADIDLTVGRRCRRFSWNINISSFCAPSFSDNDGGCAEEPLHLTDAGGVGWVILQYSSELSVVSMNCQLITVSVF